MKKVYVSIPISGKDYAAQAERANRIKRELEREGYKVITPFDIIPNPDQGYPYCMGKDIEVLLTCDAAIFAEGWNESKGCKLERAACVIYGIEIIE